MKKINHSHQYASLSPFTFLMNYKLWNFVIQLIVKFSYTDWHKSIWMYEIGAILEKRNDNKFKFVLQMCQTLSELPISLTEKS